MEICVYPVYKLKYVHLRSTEQSPHCIFDFRLHLHGATFKPVPNSRPCLPILENVLYAVETSFLSCLQADIDIFPV